MTTFEHQPLFLVLRVAVVHRFDCTCYSGYLQIETIENNIGIKNRNCLISSQIWMLAVVWVGGWVEKGVRLLNLEKLDFNYYWIFRQPLTKIKI
jgi:hypothetical protein